MSEAEIRAHQNGSDAQASDQKLFDEFLGRQLRQRTIEPQHQRGVQPHLLKSRQALRKRLNHQRGAFRTQNAASGADRT